MSIVFKCPIPKQYLKNRNTCVVNQLFGENRTDFYSELGYKGHTGIDMRTKTAMKYITDKIKHPFSDGGELKGNIFLQAVCDGTVTSIYKDSGGGVVLTLETDEIELGGKLCKLEVVYYHLHEMTIIRPYKKVGQRVKAGARIALAGNTGRYTKGAHLHFAVKPMWKTVNGYKKDLDNGYNGAIDPMPFLADGTIYSINSLTYQYGKRIS